MNKLENDHNVYILGAGFSVAAGLPTISNFMHVMRDAHEWLESQNRIKEANAIAHVLDFRLEAASAAYRVKLNLDNIEELFSLASASSRSSTEHIQLAIAATLDYKLKTHKKPIIKFNSSSQLPNSPKSWKCDQFDGFVTGETYSYECPAYEFFTRSLLGNWDIEDKVTNNSFITFNYDLLLESSLKGLQVPFSYGLDAANKKNDGIEVLKLHGSINWSKHPKSRVSYIEHQTYEDVISSNLAPQLVPPTWRKIFTGPLRQVWGKSLKSIEKATRIIIIGFSIPPTDNHFKYLIAAGLQKNISLREIIFVNPDKNLIDDRCSNLFADITNSTSVRVIGSTLDKFVSQGYNIGAIGDFGRPIPDSIQHIYL